MFAVVRAAGTAWTCAAHIITAVIGSGVLSLAWSVAQLGWVAGPACMLCFALVTYVSASILSDCYRCHDADKGPRNRSYMDAVRVFLGTILYIHHQFSVRKSQFHIQFYTELCR